MRKWSITNRWLLSTLGVTVILMLTIVFVSSKAIRDYYYDTAYMTIYSRARSQSINTFFSQYLDAPDDVFSARAGEFIENFTEQSLMEVWVIDRNGNVVATSTGFSVENEIYPDYQAALNSNTGTATWIGETSTGEAIMAVTVLLPSKQGHAVRYIISLQDLNTQHRVFTAIIAVVCTIAVGLVALSGLFFIRSIVKPVKKINETAKRIAAGDFSARLEPHRYNDEIGELVTTFNRMAKEIGEADKLKNDFISTVSHELRTPLTAIKGWGETILELHDSDPNMTKKGLEVIIDESSRLSRMVEDLLDFSRMQSGRMTLRLEKIDVLAELDETVFVFKERALREGVELTYNAPELPAPMMGDPNRIRQVFVNILDNALKYTKQGDKILVTAEILPRRLKILITDTGCGIPPEALPHVKEKFFKANVSVRGSGIGLAVSDEIVRLHKGSLNIGSVLNEGTTVEIILPIDTSPPLNERTSEDEK
ncbi:MAG TPA: HAMP domain-containing sensor histidine kinase [Clostridiales bacterium]|jgi:signal transduction histidine kinase|nr:HAMP domain-containing sensor histidine kinase [Clostridiales bacterium]